MIEASLFVRRQSCEPIGRHYVIRPFIVTDAAALSLYFRQLPAQSRYDRFLGAVEAPSVNELTKLALQGRLKTLAAVRGEGQVIGEARYAFDATGEAVEFAVSVANSEQGTGVGSAFLNQIEQHAAYAGASVIFGDTLRTNGKMLALAKRRGFRFSHPPGDWTLVRFERRVPDPVWTFPVSQSAILVDQQR